MKYITKSKEFEHCFVEAILWTGHKFEGHTESSREWIGEALNKFADEPGAIMRINKESGNEIHVNTVFGTMTALPGNYIVRLSSSNITTFPPKNFHETYELYEKKQDSSVKQVDIEIFEATDEILAPLQARIEGLLNNIPSLDTSDLNKLIEAINHYFEISDEVIQNINQLNKDRYSSVERLTSLQKELGYKKGELSAVAVLGLVGESGEVLMETNIQPLNQSNYKQLPRHIEEAIESTMHIERYKKIIRKDSHKVICSANESDNVKLKSELADTVYYANIIALNVGVTLFDLCQMAHDKIKRKQAEGGSSEDPKK